MSIGQESDGHIAGFGWSTLQISRFVAPADEDVVLGRPVPAFQLPGRIDEP